MQTEIVHTLHVLINVHLITYCPSLRLTLAPSLQVLRLYGQNGLIDNRW
jgi:hypothetical protein